MIDLIANGLSLRKPQQDQNRDSDNSNPQDARNKYAKDKYDVYSKSAQSAYSAKRADRLNASRKIALRIMREMRKTNPALHTYLRIGCGTIADLMSSIQ
jgi:hypothetical protein